jgi:hypothetical protein
VSSFGSAFVFLDSLHISGMSENYYYYSHVLCLSGRLWESRDCEDHSENNLVNFG